MSGLYNQGPVQTERDTTMRDLLAVVFKRKWLIITFFLATSGLVALKVMTTPKTWSADVTLMLQRQGRTSVMERTSRALPWVEVIESEVEIAKSVPVLQLAVAKLYEPTKDFPEGIKTSVGSLNNMVQTGGVGESNVIYITSTADSPEKAIRIANMVGEAYVEYHQKMFALPEVSGKIQHQADSTLTALRVMQDRREQILKEAGITDLKTEASNLQGLRRNLNQQLTDAKIEVARLRAQVDAIPKSVDGLSSNLPFSLPRGFTQPEVMLTTLTNYRKKEHELDELRVRYTATHPKVIKAEAELEELRKELQDTIHQLVELKREELAVAEARVRNIHGQIDGIEKKLSRLPTWMNEIELLDTQIDGARKQYASLTKMYADTKMSEASFQDYGVSMLSPAISAYLNAKGDPVRMALAPLLSLLAGIGLAFYLENLDHSMKTREDIEQHLEIPVLASFPDVEQSESDLEPRVKRTPFWRGRRGGR